MDLLSTFITVCWGGSRTARMGDPKGGDTLSEMGVTTRLST